MRQLCLEKISNSDIRIAFLIGEVLHITEEQGIIRTNNLAQDLVILNHDKRTYKYSHIVHRNSNTLSVPYSVWTPAK